ncbi:flagellar hook protein FlgE [Pseudoalteromonas prydzensis]|uniref:flagellar hook protein FlgE n=1 Tax=Pseudoalteromonas prydzensis TaxID=182141 RepID=UPI0007E51960|nr:flagellar hook-basal body complex protein [Pseudoalteromonas prydzensis]MBE0378057.1 flagellar hook protein FlgE [Pseudoalteromonas prydzensis ACAM 620]
MSMFNIGLSGLKSTQTGLEVTSNNIANSSTAGYKTGNAEFAAVYNGGNRGGVRVSDIKEDFVTSGDIVRTGNALDIAIDGQGFFAVSEGDRIAYTQAGQFSLDNDLNIVNANGAKLQGYGITDTDSADDEAIIPGILTDLKIEGANIPAAASDTVAFNGNLSSASDFIPYPAAPAAFDPTDGTQYNFSQLTEVFDSQGNSHVLTQYFNHTGDNQWQVMYLMDGEPLSQADISASGGVVGIQNVNVDGTIIPAGVVSVEFDSNGQMIPLEQAAPPPPTTPPTPPPPPLTPPDNNIDDPHNKREVNLSFNVDGGASPMSLTLDMAKTTQFSSNFSMIENDANGYPAGTFSGISVEEDGKIFATFTNGESKLQGQVVLASFANTNGLQSGDDTVWYETKESGNAIYSEPDSGAIGNLIAGAYVGSNVDISAQLVGLMSFQQNYQANAKTISSADEMMQILFSNT